MHSDLHLPDSLDLHGPSMLLQHHPQHYASHIITDPTNIGNNVRTGALTHGFSSGKPPVDL